MRKKKILVTGGDGRFAKVLKKENKKLNLLLTTKKQFPYCLEYRNNVISILKNDIFVASGIQSNDISLQGTPQNCSVYGLKKISNR